MAVWRATDGTVAVPIRGMADIFIILGNRHLVEKRRMKAAKNSLLHHNVFRIVTPSSVA